MTKLVRGSLWFFALATAFQLYALAEPYASVEILPEYPFSYYTNEKEIADLFAKNDIRVVVEVGSWIGGGSTRHMAQLLKQRQGKLYAVDTWLGNITQQPGGEHYQPILPVVYEQFLSNMIHWNLTDIVIPYRMASVEAAKVLQVQPDLIYIDAEHTTEAVYADLVAWWPFVKNYGIFCGDDWAWRPVQIAVERFAIEHNLILETSSNFWRLKRHDDSPLRTKIGLARSKKLNDLYDQAHSL